MYVITDDIVFALAAFVPPRDLVSLALTCKHLGGRPGGYTKKRKRRQRALFSARKRSPAQKLEAERVREERARAIEVEGREWSLVEEAAKRIVDVARAGDDEWNETFLSGQLTKRESWIRVLERLLQFRASLVFSGFVGAAVGSSINHVKGDLSAVQCRNSKFACHSLAFCQEVMKTGRHFVQFRVKSESGVFMLPLGLMRPIPHKVSRPLRRIVRQVTSDDAVHVNMGMRYPVLMPCGFRRYCSDNAGTPGFEGDCHYFFLPVMSGGGGEVWLVPGPTIPGEGMFHDAPGVVHPLRGEGGIDSVMGLLLDLDNGTLALYQDGRRVGVIKQGLRGHYRWTTYLSRSNATCHTLKVRRSPIPAEQTNHPGFVMMAQAGAAEPEE